MTDPADTLPARIISYAWGESYLEDLLRLALPALLAPGNLPHLASQVKCQLIIVTEERFFAKIAADRVMARVRQLCPIRLVSLDDLITRSDQYGMALTYALHRAFADLGPAMTDYWLIFFNADFILADGSLRNLLDHFRRGERIIAAPSYCTIKDAAVVELKKRAAADPTVLAIPPREMARLILTHRHDTIRGKTINEPGPHMYYMDQFYWLADENTLLGSQMPVAIVGMRPERHVVEPNTNWDHGLMLEYCPEAAVKLLGDSDEFVMLELRDRGISQNELVSGTPDIRALGERMIKWVTSYQVAFAKRPLILHAGDPPPSVDQARGQLDDFIDRILSYVPKFPTHVDHPQWNYHWPDFMKTRHAFLGDKYRAMTADLPPPQWMYPVDRLWWRLTGIETARARKIGLMTDAIKEIDRELSAYPRLLVEKLAGMNLQVDGAALAGAPGLSLGGEPETCAGSGQISGEVASTLQSVEDAFVRKVRDANRKKAVLGDAIAAAEGEFLAREGAAYEKLKREYESLMRPRVKTAGIPIVERRVGKDAAAVRTERNLRQLLRSAYDTAFGRWPRVTMLSPYWAALLPLHRAIDRAEADGARDVLLVGNEPHIRDAINDFAEAYSWISLTEILSGPLDRAIPKEQVFDLCILDLSTLDPSELPGVFAAVRPYVAPGGSIIVFQMNGGQPLPAVPPIHGELEFSGSTLSIRAAAIHSASFSPIDGSRRAGLVRSALALALSTPLAFLANCIEGVARGNGRPVSPRLRTSATVTIPLPAFEGDDGSIDYAVAAGVYIAGVEAAIAPENQVSGEVANPPGTAVIFAFGQSNAANDGAVRYVPRHGVHVFNIFDMKYYKAADPLPGATNNAGSVWGRLGDKLIESGRFSSVLFVPIAYGASFIKDWSPVAGQCYRRLEFALMRLKRAGIRIDLMCWHQGEAEANHTMMSAKEYASRFRLIVAQIRRAGVDAPIYVAKASICENGPHPYNNHEQIRRAQKMLVSRRAGLLAGPDTDEFDGGFRSDGCHLSEKGLDAVAQAWLEAIIKSPPPCLAAGSAKARRQRQRVTISSGA